MQPGSPCFLQSKPMMAAAAAAVHAYIIFILGSRSRGGGITYYILFVRAAFDFNETDVLTH